MRVCLPTIRNMKIHVANVKPLQLIINNQKNIVTVILSLTIKNIIVRLCYGVVKLRRREIEVLQIVRKTSSFQVSSFSEIKCFTLLSLSRSVRNKL